MKTPDEIKKGLKFCAKPYHPVINKCEFCQYGAVPGCEQALKEDTLAYIKQLEDVIDRCYEIAKTINVEELNNSTKVIRCKNCAYLTRSPWGHHELGWCKLHGHHRKPDYYCASAKQKEDKM